MKKTLFICLTEKLAVIAENIKLKKIGIFEAPKTFNANKLKNYFGTELFYSKLFEIINNWPEKNEFLSNYPLLIKNLKEQKRFIKINFEWNMLHDAYCDWENLATEEKFDEIFDFEKVQEKIKETPKRVIY